MVELQVLASAIFSLILIVILDLIGLKIALKYRSTKNRTVLFMGLSWIGIGQLWLSSFITVFLVVLDPTSTGLTPEMYLILSSSFLPLTGLVYITAVTDLILSKYQRLLQVIVIAYGAFFEFIMFYFIASGNISTLLVKNNYYDVENSIITISLLLPLILAFVFFGFAIAFEALKSEHKETKLKGRLLIIAYLLFTIGTILDSLLTTPLLDFLDRIFIIAGAIFFYFGYTLPEWIKKLFLKTT